MRKGMRVGSGRKGYYNVLGSDPRVHRQSAMGMKQPQKLPIGALVTSRFTQAKGRVVSNNPFAVKYDIGDKKAVRLSNPKYWQKGGKCNHVFDDVVGYGVHCIKCGYKPANIISNPYKLPTVTYRGKVYFVDFKLGELRNVATAEPIKFTQLGGDAKDRIHSELRGLRSRYWANEYIAGVDDVKGEMQKGGKQQIMPEGRISYNPIGYLKSHGYKIVKKPKDAQYQGVGEEGVFYYSKKTGNTYIQSSDGKYYLKGGKAPPKEFFDNLQKQDKFPFDKKKTKPFPLPIETAMYVPSTDKNQNQISAKEYGKRIKQTETFLHKLLGGFTRIDHLGGSTEKGRLVEEKGAKVVSFTDAQTFNANKQKYQNFIQRKRKEWGQNTIGFETEGDLFYIK
jgi:hypothetical protein